MTATEELRRLLDERGIEWERGLPTETIVREPIDALYVERPDGRMHVYVRSYFTPAHAIAATLGAGECKVESTTKWDWDRCEPYWVHELSCGHTVTTMEPEPPRFCPECGRQVKS